MATTRKPSKMLTESQAAYVDAKMTNAVMPAVVKNPTNTGRSQTVQDELARAREEITDLTTLKRLDVIEGIMEGINVAKLTADGGNMIRGWVEIGKILGVYAPEVKNINLSLSQDRLRAKFEGLSDQDLMDIIEAEVVQPPALPRYDS